MSQKLYVGGLNAITDDARLRAAFVEYGEVTEATVVTQRDSGASRCFGFVTFADSECGERAIKGKDSSDLDGNTIAVSVARERGAREISSFGR